MITAEQFSQDIVIYGNKEIIQTENGLRAKPIYKAWEHFKSVYDEILPDQRLEAQLEGIYTHYPFHLEEFYRYIKRTLDEETPDQYKKRWTSYRDLFLDQLDAYNQLTVYRGIGENSLEEDLAISYTVDKEKAEWFANRSKLFAESFGCTDDSYNEVIERYVNVSDILFYTNCREEQEIIIKPDCLDDLEIYFSSGAAI